MKSTINQYESEILQDLGAAIRIHEEAMERERGALEAMLLVDEHEREKFWELIMDPDVTHFDALRILGITVERSALDGDPLDAAIKECGGN